MPGGPEHETGQPLLKPEADCGGDRAVDDGDPARCAAEQDRRPEAPVDGSLEAFEMLSGAERDRSHAISAPPPKLRSEEHTSELQSLMRISYAVFCLQKKITQKHR